MATLRMFEFSFGDTEDEGISCSASIAAENPHHALTRLRELLPSAIKVDLSGHPLNSPDESIIIRFNHPGITIHDIHDDYAMEDGTLYPWTVFYRDIDSGPDEETSFTFECQAESAAHAKEQCLNAYPDAIIQDAIRNRCSTPI